MWKRWTICPVAGHKWKKVSYGDHDDSGYFVRCGRCGHESHDTGTTHWLGAGG